MTYLGNVINLFSKEVNKAIAAGGTTISLTGFKETPAITVTPVGATALVPLITANLVGYWPFDEGSWTVAHDASGNGHDGTLVGGPTWVDGVVGKCLSFGGSNYVTIPSSEDFNFGVGDFSFGVGGILIV